MMIAKWLSYEFTIYEMDSASWSELAGVYIFAGIAQNGQWSALYIGQCENFKDRLANHERWAEARQRGATHVHARVVPLAAGRTAIERELIGACQPLLNTQHR